LVDRLDLITILAYLVDTILLVILFVVAGPSVASPGIGPSILFFGISIFPFVYPAYWAFDIRKALRVRLYRSQALGIGLVCISYVAGAWDSTGTAYGLFILVVFYWIDASFRAARRSDPLLRDSLYWTKLRIPFWILNGGIIIGGTIAILLGYSIFVPTSSSLGGALVSVPFFIVAASGVALGTVVAGRSGDWNLRKHLAWFALFIFTQFASIGVAQVNSLSGFVYFLGFEFAGFFLYKSARSLVQFNRISLQ
jgi:hypothetical protein